MGALHRAALAGEVLPARVVHGELVTSRTSISSATGTSPPSGLDANGRMLSLLLWRFWDDDARVHLSGEDTKRLTPILLAHEMGAFARAKLGRMHGVRTRANDKRVELVAARLDQESVPYLLWNEWSYARLYPDPALRPVRGLDLLVDPADASRAKRALQPVNLGDALMLKSITAFPALYERSTERLAGELAVRCLGPEDELRMACLELVKQGAERPHALCDVALLLERGAQELEAQWVLHRAPWVTVSLQLARDVLGARVPTTLAHALPHERAPKWVERALLHAWGHPKTTLNRPAIDYVRAPRAWVTVLRDRMPNPIAVKVAADQTPRCSSLSARVAVLRATARELIATCRQILRTV